MNKFILVAMDKETYTKEELRRNADAAHAAYAAYDACDAYDASAAAPTSACAASAAYAAYSPSKYSASNLEYWLNEHFEETGENRQDYIDAIEASK